jgi:hypothetical protein
VRPRASGGADGYTVGFSRRKKLGGADATVRGEGGGGEAGRKPRPGGEAGQWLGLEEGGGPREERGSGPVADHTGRAEKKEAVPKSKEVKEKSI